MAGVQNLLPLVYLLYIMQPHFSLHSSINRSVTNSAIKGSTLANLSLALFQVKQLPISYLESLRLLPNGSLLVFCASDMVRTSCDVMVRLLHEVRLLIARRALAWLHQG